MPRPLQEQDWDQIGFAEVFEDYKNLVFKTAFLILGDTVEAEEALQEVFVLVYRARSSYDPGKGSLSTWLHRITINHCLGQLRRRRLVYLPLEDEGASSHGETIESRLSRLDEKRTVIRAIRRLSAKLRVVVTLRYYWELPYAEIAQILEVPLGTVKSRIDLALKTLRMKLVDPEIKPGLGSSAEEEIHP